VIAFFRRIFGIPAGNPERDRPPAILSNEEAKEVWTSLGPPDWNGEPGTALEWDHQYEDIKVRVYDVMYSLSGQYGESGDRSERLIGACLLAAVKKLKEVDDQS